MALAISVSPVHAAWIDNGIPLGTASGAQDLPAIAADGTGGAVIVWRDSRTVVNTDIYAQAVDSEGTIRWYPIGMPVCIAAGSQSAPRVIPDGAGGTLIAWHDNRTGGSTDIYIQKLGVTGYVQWPTDGVALVTGQTGLIMGGIVSDGSGGAIVVWQDRRDYYYGIFAQRIASNGTVMWTAGGVTVCSEIEHQQDPVIASDGAGGAIIAWADDRSGTYDIYAQRLDASGAAQWTAGGVPVCDSGQNQTDPQIVEDGSGGAVIAWSDRRNTMDFDIFAQRIDSSGSLQWGYGTPVSAWMYDQEDCRLVHIGSGETVVTWLDGRSGASTDVYAQKIDASGAVQWTANGVAVCDAASEQSEARIADNGSGGAFVSWTDDRSGSSDLGVFVQNIGSDGSAIWTDDGRCICGAAANQHSGEISPDGSNGIFLAWTDGRDGTDKAYNHRVDTDGNIPTATLLYNYSAEPNAAGVRIDWTLSEIDEGVTFRVLRSESAGEDFRDIQADVTADGLSFTVLDRSCEPGRTYFYRIRCVDAEGSRVLFEAGPVTTPGRALELLQNSPNPFNPRTVIGYFLPESCSVRLEIFDAAGRSVKVLVDRMQSGGSYSIGWDGRNRTGAMSASGVYFYRLSAGKVTLSKKMILLK